MGLRAGSRIDQIQLSYVGDSGAFTASERWQEVHGGMGGSDRGDLHLAPGKSITLIGARTGRPHGQVDRLSLTTSDGRILGGGDGRKGNTDMLWRRGPDEVLLSFSGRAGAYLDGLQAVIARFGPLIWEPVDEAEDA